VALDQGGAQLRGSLRWRPGSPARAKIGRAIDQYYGHDFSIDGILHEIETGEIDYQSLQASGDAYSQPVVRLISALLATPSSGRLRHHFEPEQSFLRIRYRIDGGAAPDSGPSTRTYWPAWRYAHQVMSKMNIAETRARRRPHVAHVTGRAVDFRVSSQATTHGENIVLRISRPAEGIVPLGRPGLEAASFSFSRR